MPVRHQPERLRVLHVASGLGPRAGGPSTAALQMCEALVRHGVTVSLYGTNVDHPGNWFARHPSRVLDVHVDFPVEVNGVNIRYFATRRPHRFGFSPSMAKRLREVIRDFDLVHVHSLYLFPTLAATHYARRSRVPYLLRPHGTLDPYMRRRHSFQKALYNFAIERRNLNHAAAIHYTSKNEMEKAEELGIEAPGVVIPLGIDGNEFAHLPPRGGFRQAHPSLKGKRLIVFLGRITAKKGLDLLAQAFAVVIRRFDDAHLVIAGPDDEGYSTQVRAHLERLGVSERATMVGLVVGKEKLELLADADVWVLPSYSENFGLAVAEAMACGLPVVISDRVDIHKDIAKANAGLVVACRAEEVAAAISRILEDESLSQRLGAAAKALVLSQFTWDIAAAKLIKTYREVSNLRNSGVNAVATVP